MTDLSTLTPAELATKVSDSWKKHRIAKARYDLATAEYGYSSDQARAAKVEDDLTVTEWSRCRVELVKRARQHLVDTGFGVEAELLASVIQ